MKLSRILLTLAALSSTSSLAATYTVRNGDTLYSIAQSAGVDVRTVMQLNAMSSTTIQVGQQLQLGADASLENQQGSNSNLVTTPASSGSAFVRTATSRFLGIRYALGGTSTRGIDCSGFTMRVFQQMGINLPRTAAAQWRVGMAVSRRNLQPGDLVFFNTTGRVASHVGIYMGNGMMANANSYYGRTMIEPLFSSSYWSARYVGARRVLN